MSYYAVAVGREVGVFPSWEDAKRQVSGFPGAKHKKFRTKVEAERFLSQKFEGESLAPSPRHISEAHQDHAPSPPLPTHQRSPGEDAASPNFGKRLRQAPSTLSPMPSARASKLHRPDTFIAFCDGSALGNGRFMNLLNVELMVGQAAAPDMRVSSPIARNGRRQAVFPASPPTTVPSIWQLWRLCDAPTKRTLSRHALCPSPQTASCWFAP